MTDPDFPVIIFHNPDCGTSRNTVAMVRAAGYAPEIIDYLRTGWIADQLRDLASRAGTPLRSWLREKGTPAADLGLLEAEICDDALIAAMVENPVLVNRPLVSTPKGVRLCRPSEVVFDLLDRKPAAFTKEDGEVVEPRAQ